MLTLIANIVKLVSALALFTYSFALLVSLVDYKQRKSKNTPVCDDCEYLEEIHGKGTDRVWICNLDDNYDPKCSPVYYCCHHKAREEETEVEDKTC